MRHWSYEVPAFWVSRCTHCTFETIHLLSTPGKAMVFTDSSHSLHIVSSKFAPIEQPVPFQSDRFISMTVDGLFFAKTMGRILIEDVEVGWNGDDCVNIHDPVGVGLRRVDWDTMVVGKSPAWRMEFAGGDQIELRNPDYSEVGYQANVLAAWQSGGEEWTVKLDKGLPDFSGVDTSRLLVVNKRWSASDVTIRRVWCHGESSERPQGARECTDGCEDLGEWRRSYSDSLALGSPRSSTDNRARALLLQIPNVHVSSSLFSDIQMSAIRITASAYWGEGHSVINAAIVNNTFRNVDKMNLGYGAVWTNLEWDESGDASEFAGHRNLRVEGNVVEGVPGRAVTIQSADGVTVRGNKVETAVGSGGSSRWDRGQIFMEKSLRVEVVENSWVGGANGENVIAGGGNGVGGARNVLVR